MPESKDNKGNANTFRTKRYAVLPETSNSCLVALLATFAIQHQSGQQHFAWIPSVLMLAILVFSSILGFTLNSISAIRRTNTIKSICLALFSLLPLTLLGWMGITAGESWKNRDITPTPLLRVAKCFGATLMEAQLALGSYQRLERPRFILFHHGLSHPKEQADRMDAYLDQLEQKFNRHLTKRIHWVRGSLLGQGSLSVYGLVLTRSDTTTDTETDITESDRHEMAHAVMNQWMPPNADPPTLLSEGWAEANERPEPKWAANSYFNSQSNADFPILGSVFTTLTNEHWYYQDSGYVYVGGYALTLYLIDRYGPDAFLRLYSSISVHHVNDTFIQVYGKDLKVIEKELMDYLAANS